MSKKLLVSLSLLLLVSGAYFLSNCTSSYSAVHYSHYVDTNLTREAQVEKCGSCHKSVYENWKIGPHANAYAKLEEHIMITDSSKHFPQGYNQYVRASMEKVCATCHTGKNIFETNFAGIPHTMQAANLNRDSFPHAFAQATCRDLGNKAALLTGVDCMTCHVQKDQVVTNEHSKCSDTTGVIKSKLFSANMSCNSCHFHQVNTMKELVQKKILTTEISCVNCHQEYDAANKGTHYFYSRNEHNSKKRPDHLKIFECVKITVVPTPGGHSLKFDWTNTIMPHGYSECGDAKCVIAAVYKNKREKIILEQKINRKDFFDARKEFPIHFHTGENGNNFVYQTPILKEQDLKDYRQIDHFIIRGLVKPQYWSTDEEFKEIYRRAVSVNEAK